MDLSIIIPTYNRAELIRYSLRSLDKKFHPGIDYEVIVIDDHSTDNTCENITTEFPDIVLLSNVSKGASAARNMGLSKAKGRYLLYLDSDDLIGPGYFSKKIEFLDVNPLYDACYGAYEYFRSEAEFDDSEIIFKHKYEATEESSVKHLDFYLGGRYLPQNAIIWRADIVRKCNGHDPSLKINQDVDLFIRALFEGMRIIGMDDNTKVYIRDHVLDGRVGATGKDKAKYAQILSLRKRYYETLLSLGYKDKYIYESLSNYLFGFWRTLRHSDPMIANEFLTLAKQVYWPLRLKGNLPFTLLSYIAGPVNATKIKYFIYKRDL